MKALIATVCLLGPLDRKKSELFDNRGFYGQSRPKIRENVRLYIR